MDPLSDKIKYDKNRNLVTNPYLFTNGVTYFFSQPKNQKVELRYYFFGLSHDSLHYVRNDKWLQIYDIVKKVFPELIDHELSLAIERGKDLDFEIDEVEADKVDSLFWGISRAIKYQRPIWSFFMFLGKVQALWNGAKIDQERLQQYFECFPKDVLINYGELMQFTFNFFDERGTHIAISKIGDVRLNKVGTPVYPQVKF
jgi:hypothetical protein